MIEANWQEQAQEYLINEDYSIAAKLYREAIEREPDIKSYYWYLGLLLLLQGQETEAQVTWFTALSEVAPADFDTKELLEVLKFLDEDFYNTKDLILKLTRHLDTTEISYNKILEEFNRRTNNVN